MANNRYPQCGTFAHERPIPLWAVLVLVGVIVVLPTVARLIGYESIVDLIQLLGTLVLLAEATRPRHGRVAR